MTRVVLHVQRFPSLSESPGFDATLLSAQAGYSSPIQSFGLEVDPKFHALLLLLRLKVED